MRAIYEDDQVSISSVSIAEESASCECISTKAILLFVFGSLICVIGLVDMIVLYVVPTKMANDNKKNFPNSTFQKPNKAIIALHFVLHILIIFLGANMIVLGYIEYSNPSSFPFTTSIIVISILVFGVWVAHLAVCYAKLISIKSHIDSVEMANILSSRKPVDFIFVYLKGSVSTTDCSQSDRDGVSHCKTVTETCYSKKGVKIPIVTSITSYPYDFSGIPQSMFLDVQQEISMSDEMRNNYNNIVNNLKKCDSKNGDYVVYQYYPKINGTYFISTKKMPTTLKKASRISSMIFGAGVFYEIYSKSFPYASYKQLMSGVTDGTDYEQLFSCSNDYRCYTSNSEPKP